MQRYANNITTQSGLAVPGAIVTVLNYPSLTTATIYSTSDGAAQANPIATDKLGFFAFYAADGRYSLSISGKGIASYQLDDIHFEDQLSLDSGTGSDAGALTGSEMLPATRGAGLLQTTLTKIAQWVIGTYQGFTQSGTGAVARSVQEELAVRVHVFQFMTDAQIASVQNTSNAVDVSAAVQAALTYINSIDPTGSLGGLLEFPPGVFNVTAPNTFRAIKWKGSGARVTTIKLNATAGNIITLPDASEFEDIQFSADNLTSGAVFYVPSGMTAVFRRCWAQDFYKFIISAGTLKLVDFDAFNGAYNSANITSGCAVIEVTGGRLLAHDFRSNVASTYGGKLPHPAIRVFAAQEVKLTGHSNIQNHANGVEINVASGALVVDFELNGAIISSCSGDAVNVVTVSGANIRRLALIGGNLDSNGGNGLGLQSHAGGMTTLQAIGARINGNAAYGINLAGTISNLQVCCEFDSNTSGTINNASTNSNYSIMAPGVASAYSAHVLVGTQTDDGSGNRLQVNGTISLTPSTTTSAPAAGAAGALPSAPTGYFNITIGGTTRKVAYY